MNRKGGIRFTRGLKVWLLDQRYHLIGRYKPKVFCIGLSNTKSSILSKTLEREGIKIGNCEAIQSLLKMYTSQNIDRIVDHCNTAQAFIGVPFSIPSIYQYLNDAFPSAKFILTTIGSGEEWFKSCENTAIYRFGKVPSLNDFKKYRYSCYGWSYESHQALFGEGTEFDDAETKIEIYDQHIENAKAYFDRQPDRLLVVNMHKESAFREICEFLRLKTRYDGFPIVHHKGKGGQYL